MPTFDILSNRVLMWKKPGLYFRTYHSYGIGFLNMGGSKKRSVFERKVENIEKIRGYTAELCQSSHPIFDHGHIVNHFGTNPRNGRNNFCNALGILESEARREPANHALVFFFLTLGFFNRPWQHNDVVYTHQFDLFKNFLLGSCSNGKHGNYCRYAKYDPECS